MIIALKNKVIIAPLSAKEETKNGIFIPSTGDKRKGQGLVIAIGDGCDLDEVKVGYIVLYKEWSGTKITHDLETYIIIDSDDIIAILTDSIEDLGMTNEEQAQKFFKEILQPFRYGKFSKEFSESYPDQTRKMINAGSLTEAEVAQAEYVYKNVAGWKEWKKNGKERKQA